MLNIGNADRAATVVPFRSRPSAERRRQAEPTGAIGQLLFFTGIRYERLSAEVPADAAGEADAPDRDAEEAC